MGERGEGEVERPKKKTIHHMQERKGRKACTLELVLVWIERALRICRKLCFQERLFD
jgi:hypothetical protein